MVVGLAIVQASGSNKPVKESKASKSSVKETATNANSTKQVSVGAPELVKKKLTKREVSSNDERGLVLSSTAHRRMGDSADLDTAAGEYKKYVLVKKKPKHKKIKMEVLKPEIKYKKIITKVPYKKMKKQKVKGYLVKKEHKHHGY